MQCWSQAQTPNQPQHRSLSVLQILLGASSICSRWGLWMKLVQSLSIKQWYSMCMRKYVCMFLLHSPQQRLAMVLVCFSLALQTRRSVREILVSLTPSPAWRHNEWRWQKRWWRWRRYLEQWSTHKHRFMWLIMWLALDELKQDYVDEQTGESGPTLK